jgi:RNA polymerase sigma factor (sigma-70 family)
MEKQFDSLSTYISLAKKTISKFAPKFYNGLAKEMLSNEEAVSDIATAIMYADWRYDSSRTGKTGLKKTLYSYRNQCAIWAIKTYVTNKYKQNKHVSINYISDDTNHDLSGVIAQKDSLSPVDELIEKEYNDNIKTNIDLLLNNNILTDKQRDQIKMYYFNDMTLTEIGKHYGISREAVRQNIKRGIDLIKKYDKCYS